MLILVWDIIFNRKMKQNLFILFLLVPVFYSCLNGPEMPLGTINGKREPTVVSKQGEVNVEGGFVLLEGEIISIGKGEILHDKGFLWSFTSSNPGLSDNILSMSGEAGNSLSYEMRNIPGDTTIYWRTFAQNEYGVDMGEVRRMRTPLVLESKEEFRSHLRMRFAYFALNDNFYVVCGDADNGALAETWEYDVEADKWWGTIPAFPGGERRYPVAFTIGDKAYVGTGQRSYSEIFNDFYCFDGKTRRWNQEPISFDVGRYNCAAFSLNNKGYVVGGTSVRYLKEVWRFSDNPYLWERMNDFPVDLFGGISISNGERTFVGFGENTEAKNFLWEYNESDDAWEEYLELPEEIDTKIYSGAIVNNYFYLIDGNNDIWQMDITDKILMKKLSLPDIFLHSDNSGGDQCIFIQPNSASLYIGMGFTEHFYIYRPLWDN
jgi:hypothetical protein